MIDIIIPFYGQGELTVKCISSVLEHTPKDTYRLIVVNNGSHATPRGAIEALAVEVLLENTHPQRLYVLNHRNLGFIKAVNQGLTLSTSEYVILLNNDTEVPEGWLEKLVRPMIEDELIGSVGPVTTSPDCWQGREKPSKIPQTRILPASAMLAFFCVAIRKKVVEEIGLLDESFGMGLGDDDDYCERIKQAGYSLALVKDLVVPHKHRSTFKKLFSREELEKMTAEGIAHFKEKHGL